jgi:hypothetical protein
MSFASASNNIAISEGTGVAGQTLVLLCNGKDCRTTIVDTNGLWKVSSSRLGSGTTAFAVRIVSSQGLESDQVAAGSVSILPAPVITGASQNGGILAIKANGTPGATAKVYMNGMLIDLPPVVVAGDGSITIPPITLSLGTNVITMTVEDAAGISDLSEPVSVIFTSNTKASTSYTLSATTSESSTSTRHMSTSTSDSQTSATHTLTSTSESQTTTAHTLTTSTMSKETSHTSSTSITTTKTPYPILIASEDFDSYPDGTLDSCPGGCNGGTGWAGAWFSFSGAYKPVEVTNGSLFHIKNTAEDEIRVSGRMTTIAVTSADYAKAWVSFRSEFSLLSGGGTPQIRMQEAGGGSGLTVGSNDCCVGFYTLLWNSNDSGNKTSVPLDSAQWVLMEVDYIAGKTRLWLDPAVEYDVLARQLPTTPPLAEISLTHGINGIHVATREMKLFDKFTIYALPSRL